MIMNGGSHYYWKRPPLWDNATYVGHAGATYGFQSNQGYFKALNASMSIITNQDYHGSYPAIALCPIIEIVMKYKGVEKTTRDPLCKDFKIDVPKMACATWGNCIT